MKIWTKEDTAAFIEGAVRPMLKWTDAEWLLHTCLGYNKLSENEKRSKRGRREYARMKLLNERVLNHD